MNMRNLDKTFVKPMINWAEAKWIIERKAVLKINKLKPIIKRHN